MNISKRNPESLTLENGEEIQFNSGDWPLENDEPVRKSLCKWNGSAVVLKSEAELLQEYIDTKFDELKKHIQENWMLSTKSQDLIRAQYLVYTGKTWILTAQVDADFETFKKWMVE